MFFIKELSKSNKIKNLLISVIIFSGLYYLCDLYADLTPEYPHEYLYFTLVTQTTVGYDSHSKIFNKLLKKYPNTWSPHKVVNLIQLISLFFLL